VSTDEKLEEEKMPDKKKESIYKASMLILHRSLCAKKTKQKTIIGPEIFIV